MIPCFFLFFSVSFPSRDRNTRLSATFHVWGSMLDASDFGGSNVFVGPGGWIMWAISPEDAVDSKKWNMAGLQLHTKARGKTSINHPMSMLLFGVYCSIVFEALIFRSFVSSGALATEQEFAQTLGLQIAQSSKVLLTYFRLQGICYLYTLEA